MTQAKRINRKPINKTKKVRVKSNFPWGLMLVILVSGVALGMLIKGSMENEHGFGSGLNQLFKQQVDQENDPEIAKLIKNKSTEKEFEFYELLPNIERIMPDDLTEAKPERANVALDYYIQAASFRQHSDAEKLRAQFALKGYKSVTQAKEVEGKGTFYRVRLGPYDSKRKAKAVVNKLKRLGAHGFIYTVKK